MSERKGTPSRVRAALVGVAAVLGACGGGGKSADPTRALPPSIATVAVTPGFQSVVVGDSLQVVPQAVDSAGAEVTSARFGWRSTEPDRAGVTDAGLVRARQPGETTIVATAGALSASATVLVVQQSCDGPPPWSCEPPGMTLVTDYGFDQLQGGGWAYQQKAARAQVVTDSTAPVGGGVLEFVYPQGFTGAGDSPGALRPPPIGTNRKELYWGFHWKASPGWQNHASNANKLLYGWMNGNSTFGLTWHWGFTSKPNGQRLEKMLGFFEGATYYFPNTNEAFPIVAGRWYRVEMYFKPSSAPGAADGIVRVWINGVLYANHTTARTASGQITEIYFDPTWGGVGGATKQTQDYYRFDHARISVR